MGLTADYSGNGWRIVEGDCLSFLQTYDGEPFDAVITDVPYSSGGATRGDRMGSTTDKYVSTGSGNRELVGFEGDNRDQRSFVLWCSLWMMAAWRASKPGATAHFFTDWRQLPAVTDAVQAGGWVWRGIVPWNKGLGTRPYMGRHRAQCEYLVFATRGPHEAWDGAPALPGFYECSTPRERIHITEKPVALIQDIATLCPPGGLVFDGFVGSGAHGEGVLLSGRRFLGCEISPPIAAMAADRLHALDAGSTYSAQQSGQAALFAESDQPAACGVKGE